MSFPQIFFFGPQFDVFREVLLNRPTATWNLVVLHNEHKSKKYILASYRLTVRGFFPAWALTLLLTEAREGNCQRLIEKRLPSMSKNDEMAGGTPRKLCESHSHRADFCEEGRIISGHLANRLGSRFGTKTKLLRSRTSPQRPHWEQKKVAVSRGVI